TSLRFPTFGGVLDIEEAEEGMDADWLSQQSMTLALRSGGERLKLGWNRPSRSLKAHYQQADVPAWERPRLPLVFAGTQLLYAAGIGMDCHALTSGPGRRFRFDWRFDDEMDC